MEKYYTCNQNVVVLSTTVQMYTLGRIFMISQTFWVLPKL